MKCGTRHRQAQGDGINLQYKNGRSKPLPYVKFAGLNKVCPHLSMFPFPRDISLALNMTHVVILNAVKNLAEAASFEPPAFHQKVKAAKPRLLKCII